MPTYQFETGEIPGAYVKCKRTRGKNEKNIRYSVGIHMEVCRPSASIRTGVLTPFLHFFLCHPTVDFRAQSSLSRKTDLDWSGKMCPTAETISFFPHCMVLVRYRGSLVPNPTGRDVAMYETWVNKSARSHRARYFCRLKNSKSILHVALIGAGISGFCSTYVCTSAYTTRIN